MLHEKSDVLLRAVNANWNDDGWNVDANSVENPNEWNDGNQVLSRNCRDSLSIYFGRVLLSIPRFHPPNILPTSFRCSDSVV